MITINKECVDNYHKYEELQRKLNKLRHNLEQLNTPYTGRDSITSFYDTRAACMRSLYGDHADIINNALNKEVERLKEEINKYIIE